MEKISLVKRRKQAVEPASVEKPSAKEPVQQKKTARQWFEEGRSY